MTVAVLAGSATACTPGPSRSDVPSPTTVSLPTTSAAPAPIPLEPDTEDGTDEPTSGEDLDDLYVVDDGRAMVPERGGDGCEGLPSLEPRNEDNEQRVFGYWYSELRDLGQMDNATGETTYDDEGRPVSYTAAPGDTMYDIAFRFCIDHYPYVEWINAIRRGSATTIAEMGSMQVYAGDTINLDPHTIATVGDENGVVRNNLIDFHIPPQQ